MSAADPTFVVHDPAVWRSVVARWSIRFCLFGITVLDTGVYSPLLIGYQHGPKFQAAPAELLWVLVVLICLPRLNYDPSRWDRRIGFVVALIGYALLSMIWALQVSGFDALFKGLTLVFNVFAVFLLVETVDEDEVVEPMIAGFTTLIWTSAYLSVFVPEIGLETNYMHAGQWHGLFTEKQTLGVIAGILLYLSVMRFFHHTRFLPRLWHFLSMVGAVVCLVGSESRGGAVIGVGALLLGFVGRRFRSTTVIAAIVPLITFTIATTMIATLWMTDLDHFEIGSHDVDFTQRTVIWKHAIDYFVNYFDGAAPIIGAGLNGFWARKDVVDSFIGQHVWFLDNFHNGYLAVLVECGLIGYAIFAGLTLMIPTLRPPRDADRAEVARRAFNLGYIALYYVINMTETFMLRSTNTNSILFFFFLFGLLRRRDRPRRA